MTPHATLGIVLVERAVQTQEEAQAAITQIQKGEVDGFLVPRSLALNIPVSSWRLRPSGRCRSCVMGPSGWSGAASPVMVQTLRLGPAGGASGGQAPERDAGRDPGGGEREDRVRHQSEDGTRPGVDIAPEVLFQAHRLIR